MKKLLLSILTITSLTAFSQWQATSIFSSGEDCTTAFGKVLSSDANSSALDASTDDGATWASSNTGVPSSGLSFGDLNGGTLYAFRNTSIYQSTTGNNWTAMNTSAIGSSEVIKAVTVISTNSVFALTNPISGNGMKIYQLSGSTWNFKANIPTSTANLGVCMEAVNGELWIGTTATLSIKSTNGGSTWAASNGTLTSANWWDKYVLCLGGSGSTVFMGNYGGRVFRSLNGGTTWNQISYNIAGGSTISMSDIHVINGSEILLGCDSGFVYSKDGGATWTEDNVGLSFSGGVLQDPVAKVAASTNYLFLATKNGKIYRRLKSEVFSGVNELSLLNIETKIYPNPSSDFTTIEASDLLFEKNCEVKITDVLGRDISITEMKNGKAEINLNNFSKGIYTYSVYNNKTVVSKGKLVVN